MLELVAYTCYGKSNLECLPDGYLSAVDGTLHNELGLEVSSSNRDLGKRSAFPSSSIVIQAPPEEGPNENSGHVKWQRLTVSKPQGSLVTVNLLVCRRPVCSLIGEADFSSVVKILNLFFMNDWDLECQHFGCVTLIPATAPPPDCLWTPVMQLPGLTNQSPL